MRTFEVMVGRGREAEAFNTAVYRFAELRIGSIEDGIVAVVTEPMGPRERKRVTLWSDIAVEDFKRYWSMYPDRPRHSSASQA